MKTERQKVAYIKLRNKIKKKITELGIENIKEVYLTKYDETCGVYFDCKTNDYAHFIKNWLKRFYHLELFYVGQGSLNYGTYICFIYSNYDLKNNFKVLSQ